MKTFRLLTRTRQITEYSCGASALQAVLHYWGKDVDEKELMRLIGTNSDVGTWPRNIADGVREMGLKVEVRENLTLDEVARFTADGSPMIALGQVWRSQRAGGPAPEDDWDNGHYIVVLGVDDEYVYFQDPYLNMGKVFVTRRMFERHWHQSMGGAQTGSPRMEHLGILIRGDRPAPVKSTSAADYSKLDFERFGSFNLLVTRFDRFLLPFDFMDELREIWASDAVRPVAFILVNKDAEGNICAMEGGRLEEDRDAAEIGTMLHVLISRALGESQAVKETAAHALAIAARGDFGLSADGLRGLATRLKPNHSVVIVLFHNLWERRFRDVAGKYGGVVSRQSLVTSASVAAASRELLG